MGPPRSSWLWIRPAHGSGSGSARSRRSRPRAWAPGGCSRNCPSAKGYRGPAVHWLDACPSRLHLRVGAPAGPPRLSGGSTRRGRGRCQLGRSRRGGLGHVTLGGRRRRRFLRPDAYRDASCRSDGQGNSPTATLDPDRLLWPLRRCRQGSGVGSGGRLGLCRRVRARSRRMGSRHRVGHGDGRHSPGHWKVGVPQAGAFGSALARQLCPSRMDGRGPARRSRRGFARVPAPMPALPHPGRLRREDAGGWSRFRHGGPRSTRIRRDPTRHLRRPGLPQRPPVLDGPPQESPWCSSRR